jgi:hypothetical protein
MINNVSDLKSQLNDNFSYGGTFRFTKMKLESDVLYFYSVWFQETDQVCRDSLTLIRYVQKLDLSPNI